MDFALSDEQRMLQDLVERFTADRYGFETAREIQQHQPHWSPAIWAEMAELGLLCATVPTEDGGLAGGGVAAMLIGEAFGRALVAEPVMASAIWATAVLAGAPAEARAAHLPGAMDGTAPLAMIDGGIAQAQGLLTGSAPLVLGANAAATLLVFAEDAGGSTSLFSIAADGAGVTRSPGLMHGGIGMADLAFAAAPATLVVGPDLAPALRARGRDAALAYLVAEALGAAQGAFDLTIDYLKTRIQFGKPLATNQALQHRAAEMMVELEQLRSAAMLAAMMVDEPDADLRARSLAAAKIVLGRSGRFIGQNAVQMHGAIGVTEEYAVSHYFRRLTACELLLGDSASHLATLADLGGFVSAQPYWG